ncbi:unnamed protein product, partial [Parnassius apollo]
YSEYFVLCSHLTLMTPTRPVVTDDHFEENCVSPTSEVGSMQAQNADKWIEANDGLRALFEAQ